jgi:hypothetical protein
VAPVWLLAQEIIDLLKARGKKGSFHSFGVLSWLVALPTAHRMELFKAFSGIV